MPPPEVSLRTTASQARSWISRLLSLIVVAVVFGWFYEWAAPRAYPADERAGFGYGLLHGALMPMAFPTLIMGKDVPIYAERNTGRRYKLGYIAGINLCGLVFFGSALWRPPGKSSRTETGSYASSHSSHPQ